MGTATSAQAFLPRSLVAIALAALVQLAFGELALGPMLGRAVELSDPLRASLALVVSLTAISALLVAIVATRRRSPEHAARLTAPVLGLAPAVLVPPLAFGHDPIGELAPLLSLTMAPGVVLALALERTLTSVALGLHEAAPKAELADDDALLPSRLTAKLARLVAGLGLASTMLALAWLLVRANGSERLLEPTQLVVTLGLITMLLLGVLAGTSTGLSPGRDVQSLAERFDALGWDESATHTRSLASPVRVTSFDAVGELFRHLELLRARLAEDVATYQRALDRTREAEQSKGEFLAAVSHELRTPLNSILGFAQLLLEQAPRAGAPPREGEQLSEAQAEDVRLILAGGRKLMELLEDILDLSLIESGELEIKLASCPVDALVHEIADIHRGQALQRKLELRAEPDPGLPSIQCDRRRVGQILSNLLSNAIKFTEQGCVRITATHDLARRSVEIAVHDTGVGIRAEDLEAVFEEYRQAGARKRRIAGTGLGLAIARRIAEAHGGSLVVASTIGVGSVFTLTLPERPPPHRSRDEITGEQAIAVMTQSQRMRFDELELDELAAPTQPLGPGESGPVERAHEEALR